MGELRRQRVEIARTHRTLRRLRHPLLRRVPASLSELAFVIGYGVAAFLMVLCLCGVIASLVAVVTTG